MKSLMQGIILTLTLSSVWFGDTRAIGAEASMMENTSTLLYNIVSFLSWSWVSLAALAGKLMTNDVVFGGVLNMDIYLFKIWSIMKNFANFFLGLLFLVMVVSQLWSEGAPTPSEIAKKIGGFLLAGLMINFSFFLVQAVVDISTIATTAVGGISSGLIADDTSVGGQISTLAGAQQGYRITYTEDGGIRHDPAGTSDTADIEGIIDTITPDSYSMGGPLVFLGSSILQIGDYTMVQQVLRDQAADDSRDGRRKKASLGALLQLAIIVSFSLVLLILIVANIVRIGLIWLLAALGPLLFLYRGLKRGGVLPSRLDSGVGDQVSVSKFLQLIFLPVRTVLLLSVVLIFSVILHQFATTPNGDSIQDRFDQTNGIAQIEYDGSLLTNTTVNTFTDGFAEILVILMVLFLMWIVVKQSIPSSTPLVGKWAESAFGLVQKSMLAVPIIPIPGSRGKGVGLGAIGAGLSNKNSKINPLAIGNRVAAKQAKVGQQSVQGFVNKTLGLTEVAVLDADRDLLTRELQQPNLRSSQRKDIFMKSIKKRGKNENTYFTMQELIDKGNLETVVRGLHKSNNSYISSMSLGADKQAVTDFFSNQTNVEKFVEEIKSQGFELASGITATVKNFANLRFTNKK